MKKTYQQRTRARKQAVDLARRRADRAAAEQSRRARVLACKPTIDKKLAKDFAKILLAGVPPVQALRYLAPHYYARIQTDEKAITRWLNDVASHSLVLDAINDLQGGEWHVLPAEKRLEIAIDKHMAELAHLLYTNSYEHADRSLQGKMDTAAERLLAYLRDDPQDENSPWKTFIDQFMRSHTPDLPAALPVSPSTVES